MPQTLLVQLHSPQPQNRYHNTALRPRPTPFPTPFPTPPPPHSVPLADPATATTTPAMPLFRSPRALATVPFSVLGQLQTLNSRTSDVLEAAKAGNQEQVRGRAHV